MTVHGTYETFCADPTRKGPDAAGGYPGPKTVEHWTSSVTGRPVPDTHLAYASYIVGKYGQTRSAAQAASLDAAVCEWLAGGTYGTGGARGKQCLASREVDPSARTSALGFLAGAKKYAGPLPAGPPSPHQHPAVTLERAGPITCTHFRAARCAPSGLHAAPLPGGAGPAGSPFFRLCA
ncbi:hypothetical protein [Streptomyces sp. NRRL WC-3725]|uniref:hypothetical protein n=1 Tax=Streptomyces sp. NRRL WC-3725 TaxID=1463933 RepID=UPI000A58B308|nr:hypothetical protein [Streptomyces sp. NRRL WC-3725]